MAKRILAALCGLLLCIALVGLALAASAKATLLNEDSARAAMEDSGFVAERTAYIHDTLARPFADMGLDSSVALALADEATVKQFLGQSVDFALLGSEKMAPGWVSFGSVATQVVEKLEAEGGTVTPEGLAQLEVLVQFCETVFEELTTAPMAGVMESLNGLLGAGGGLVAILLCAAVAVMAVIGVAAASRSEKTAALYLSSSLMGAGLALLVPGFVLNARLAAMADVMARYYAPFYGILLAAGGALAAVGLVLLVLRLVRRGK